MKESPVKEDVYEIQMEEIEEVNDFVQPVFSVYKESELKKVETTKAGRPLIVTIESQTAEGQQSRSELTPFQRFIAEAEPEVNAGIIPNVESMDDLLRDFNKNQKKTDKALPKKVDYWGEFNEFQNDAIDLIPSVESPQKLNRSLSDKLSDIKDEEITSKPAQAEIGEVTDTFADDFSDDPEIKTKGKAKDELR